MTEIHVSGTTYDEALASGLEQLGLAREFLEIAELADAHDDILPGAEPLEGVTLRLRVRTDAIAAKAKSHLLRMLELMGVDCQVEMLQRRGGITLNIIAGGDGSLIIGRNGQNLEALQVLVSRMVIHGGRELIPISVDMEGYRERQLGRLEQTAQRVANQALREGREVALEPMSASDRKVIHNALKEVRGVHTISRGEGPGRHIVITPGSPDLSTGLLRPGRRRETGEGSAPVMEEDFSNEINRDDYRTDIDALLREDDD